MGTKMRWDKRRPVYTPWYDREVNPFKRRAATHRQAVRLKAKPDQAKPTAYRVQADALEIEAGAKRKLADEYDAAQERGEVATRSDQNLLPEQKKVSVADVGLTHKDIHEARIIRDAEKDEPGIVRRALDEALAAGEEPTRAKVKPAPVNVPMERPTVAAGTLAPNRVFRTGDIAKARTALAGAAEATIYCDGSAAPTNPGIAGCGAVVMAGGVRLEMFAGGWRGSNNAAELQAAILALSVLPDGCRATVIADSTYLVNGMTKWRHSWRVRDFKKNGSDIPNAPRWRQLDTLASGRSVTWRWVRGHSGHAMNELADRLATLGRTGGA